MFKFLEELQNECYFEVVNDDQLEKVGLEKEDILLPKVSTAYSAGSDFFAPVDITLVSGGEVTVATGIKAHCAPYTALYIYPRSGLGFKYFVRLANTVGLVDKDYYGNEDNDGCIFVKIRNEGKKEMKIRKGEAFCQGVFQIYIPQRDHSFEFGEKRKGGLGSTSLKQNENDLYSNPHVEIKVAEDGTVTKTYHKDDESGYVDARSIESPDGYSVKVSKVYKTRKLST